MKNLSAFFAVTIAAITISCNMSNELLRPNLSSQVMGIYNGVQTSSLSATQIPATAEVTSTQHFLLNYIKMEI